MSGKAGSPKMHGLALGQDTVAEYHWQPQLPLTVSPRPYLHPVRTMAGTELTELMPADHLHHLGVSIAVPDVSGANFWGGRTFTPGRGPVAIPNHGTQHHHQWITQTAAMLSHDLRWTAPDGTDLIHERRNIAAHTLGSHAWALDIAFDLANATAAPLTFASPATNGRPGAGYGGFFWRARRGSQPLHVLGPDRTGVERLHGHSTTWLAMTGNQPDPWTLIFLNASMPVRSDRWFVRSRDYAGIGSSLAWNHPLIAAAGGQIRRRIITVVADGRLRATQAAELARTAAAMLAPELPA